MTPDEILGLPDGYINDILGGPDHTLTIPVSEWLNSNDRTHWAVRYRASQKLRVDATIIALANIKNKYQKIHVLAYTHKTHNRKYDAHNLMPTLKPIIDGIVKAGVIPDDTNDHLIGPDLRQGNKTLTPKITLHITAIKE